MAPAGCGGHALALVMSRKALRPERDVSNPLVEGTGMAEHISLRIVVAVGGSAPSGAASELMT